MFILSFFVFDSDEMESLKWSYRCYSDNACIASDDTQNKLHNIHELLSLWICLLLPARGRIRTYI